MASCDHLQMPVDQESTKRTQAGWTGRLIGLGSCVLLFLCMTYPTVSALAQFKASLFGVLLIAIALEHVFNGCSRLALPVILWTLCLVLTSIFFVMEGILAGTHGAIAVITVYILWPLTFSVWIAGLARKRFLVGLDWTVALATVFVGVYGCLYLLTSLRLLPDTGFLSALSLGWEGEGFGAHEGYTGLVTAGMNSMPFLLPYVIASIAIQTPEEKKKRFRHVILWLACIFGCAIVLTAGRRAFMLLVMLSPGLVLVFRSFQPETEKRLNRRSLITLSVLLIIGVVVLFVSISTIYEFDISSLWDRFTSGFDIRAQAPDENEAARYEQLGVLWRGWLEHPFLGSGHGAGALGSIRSDTMPWAYELSYLALLFQTGIVGFTAYLAGVLWIFHAGIKIIREGGFLGRIMLPMLTGFSGLLIANATNPYLLKFDGMWMFFLPLAVVNYRLVMPVQKSWLNYRSKPSLSFGR